MSKRNLIQEIKQKNARAEARYLHGHIELYGIERSARSLGDTDRTLLALHVMGVAACIEVSVREAIKRLIDSGSPFLDRVQAFKEHMRFDFALTKALSTRQITFGDLVSHSLPVSNLEHIASHLEALFTDSTGQRSLRRILGELREFVEPDILGSVEAEPPAMPPLLVANPEQLCDDISSVFELRHLVAHEASFDGVSHQVFTRLLASARMLVDALYELVEQTTQPGRSRNGFGQSFQRAEEAGKVAVLVADLTRTTGEHLRTCDGMNKTAVEEFERAVHAFEAYRDAELGVWFAIHGPVSGNAMRNIEASVSLRVDGHRVESLRALDEIIDLVAPSANRSSSN